VATHKEGKNDKMDLRFSNSLVDLAARIRHEHEATSAALKSSVAHAMAAGDLLLEAKTQVPHGQWLPWLKEHCLISERTAQLYMRVATNRTQIEAKTQHVADLTVRGAVALLTAPKGVEKAVLAAADSAIDELEIEACERARHERAIRRVIYERCESMLADLNPTISPVVAAVWASAESSTLDEAITDVRNALESEIGLTDAVIKFRDVLETMLARTRPQRPELTQAA
jgi:hypothetical protein